MGETRPDHCPHDLLAETIEAARHDPDRGLGRLRALLKRYGRDERLHFLHGSLLAGLRRDDEARAAMARAVETAPGYAVARFHLGFLELTSGDSEAALATWAPLDALADDSAIRLVARGLGLLVEGKFAEAIVSLEDGAARNARSREVGADVGRIIDEARLKLMEQAAAGPTATRDLLQWPWGRKPPKP